jgi:hypothetical protein
MAGSARMPRQQCDLSGTLIEIRSTHRMVVSVEILQRFVLTRVSVAIVAGQ